MKFKLDTRIDEIRPEIDHQNSLLFLGSCFSDEMAARFSKAGFEVLSNPFGTIFHPLPLARILENALDQNGDFHFFEDRDRWFSWDASTLFSGASEAGLRADFRRIQRNLQEYLQQSKHLFVTFGTARGYVLRENQLVVANCHKQNAPRFEKQLTAIESIVSAWDRVLVKLAKLNPGLKVVFTVSPVRHAKDGLVENNRSKARLLESITLLEARSSCAYFPSYELVVDELRDYRFYKEDLVHPSELAVSYIWEKVQLACCRAETRELIRETEKMRAFSLHRSLNNDESFEAEREARIEAFKQKYPQIRW